MANPLLKRLLGDAIEMPSKGADEALLGQLLDEIHARFIDERMRGFVYNGEQHPPVTRQMAEQRWEAIASRYKDLLAFWYGQSPVIGEARFDREMGFVGYNPRPSSSAEEIVQQHLDTQGAGVPPTGRQYPEMLPSKPAGDEDEENREVQIARRLKTLASQCQGNARNAPEGRSICADINTLADELLALHGQRS